MEIDNKKYVRIDKNIIKNPAIVMNNQFFKDHKYFGFIYKIGADEVIAYYNEEGNLFTKYIRGSAFNDRPNKKTIEDADLVMFENWKIE